MRSNEHGNKESERKWDTTGLGAVPLKLVEGDKMSRNWWRKVCWSLFFSSQIDKVFHVGLFFWS